MGYPHSGKMGLHYPVLPGHIPFCPDLHQQTIILYICVRACVHGGCVRACVGACVRVCVRACVRARIYIIISIYNLSTVVYNFQYILFAAVENGVHVREEDGQAVLE